MPVTAADRILGRADAPVTVIEYASFTCPSCARFHADIVPGLKKSYIDSGKVRLVYRDFPLDRVAFAASVVARCSAADRYFGVVDLLFREQPRWAGAKDPMGALTGLAMLAGVSQAEAGDLPEGRRAAKGGAPATPDGQPEIPGGVDADPDRKQREVSRRLSLEQLGAVIDAILSGS